MKTKIFTRFLNVTVILVLMFIVPLANVFSQPPDKMSYQAVIRDAIGNLVKSSSVGMRIQILQGSEFGAAVYVETQTPATNENGLVTIEIGEGTVVTGTFSTIDWSNGPYFLKTETDPDGGTSYSITAVSQLLSVPYAFQAGTADSVTHYNETDPVFSSSVAANITEEDTVSWHNKLDAEVDGSVTNELQTLSFSNDTLSISNGNALVIPCDSSLWETNGKGINYSKGNVGIGTASPQTTLDVNGYAFAQAPVSVYGNSQGGDGSAGLLFKVIWLYNAYEDTTIVEKDNNNYEFLLKQPGWYRISYEMVFRNLTSSPYMWVELYAYKEFHADIILDEFKVNTTQRGSSGTFLVKSNGREHISLQASTDYAQVLNGGCQLAIEYLGR